MALKVTDLSNVKLVDHNDLNKLIRDTYGYTDYDMQQVDDCLPNDTLYLMRNVTTTGDPWEERNLEDFVAENSGDYHNIPYDVFVYDLCMKGIIEPGNYLISVSW